jgi:Double-stranded RNA binding motif
MKMVYSKSTHSFLTMQRRSVRRWLPSTLWRRSSCMTNAQSSSIAESSLEVWYKAVADIPLKQILPIGLGNAVERANVNAFFGDKRMNLEIAKILRRRQRTTALSSSSSSNESSSDNASENHSFEEPPSLRDLTTLQSLAMSNQLLSQCLPTVLPQHMNGDLTQMIQQNSQIHDAGTMMEAAVDVVATSRPELADLAIAELAAYLVDQAVAIQQHGDLAQMYLHSTQSQDDEDENSTSASTTGDMINPKGHLLNVGGTVEVSRMEGSPDHAPQFTATARFEDLTGTVNYCRTKKEAEHSAASMLWRYFSQVLTKKDMTCTALPTTLYDEKIENPKGRILSIGGLVSSYVLHEYPEHMPRFRAKCKKTFFVTQPSDPVDTDPDNTSKKSSYAIEATAEGRTAYEAERIASTIVWRHVMNMPTTPSFKNANPLLSRDTQFDPNEPDDTPLKEAQKLSAKQRKNERNLRKYDKKKISVFKVRDDQLNFLQYELEEQPVLVLRPGGETVIESWHRGALHPQAAFHRALIAPHVFPNHIAVVNAYTRHNLLEPDDDEETPSPAKKNSNENAAKDDHTLASSAASSDTDTRKEEEGPAFSTADHGWKPYTGEEEDDDDSEDVAWDKSADDVLDHVDDDDDDEALTESSAVTADDNDSSSDPSDNDESIASAMLETSSAADDTTIFSVADSASTATSEDEADTAFTDTDEDVGIVEDDDTMALANHDSDDGQWQLVSSKSLTGLDNSGDDHWEFVSVKTTATPDINDVPWEPSSDGNDSTWRQDDRDLGKSPSKEVHPKNTMKKSTAIKTYTVLIVVMPNLRHPKVRALNKEYNNSEVMAKCFIEHGRTPREARTAAGLAVNKYIIDVLLTDYEYLLENVPKKNNQKPSHFHAMTKLERKNMFFKF